MVICSLKKKTFGTGECLIRGSLFYQRKKRIQWTKLEYSILKQENTTNLKLINSCCNLSFTSIDPCMYHIPKSLLSVPSEGESCIRFFPLRTPHFEILGPISIICCSLRDLMRKCKYLLAFSQCQHFEDTKGVIRSRKLKDRQYNDQMKKDKQRSTKYYTET